MYCARLGWAYGLCVMPGVCYRSLARIKCNQRLGAHGPYTFIALENFCYFVEVENACYTEVLAVSG